jgi:ATP-dependent protease ClpP protease subunit
MPRPDPRAVLVRAVADREWFRIGQPRAEVVGDQGAAPGGGGAEDTRSTADVYVFDMIGGWMGVSAEDFVRDVAALDVDHLNVHLNSPGGDAAEGVAIANVLRQHRADVTIWVDGIAASAASVIAMAGDEVVMSVGSQLMIHDAWGFSQGNAAEMRKAAEMLDSTSNALASTYAAKTGGTTEEWRAVMAAEAWYTADEAVTAKLADRVATDADNGSASGEQVVPGSASGWLFDWWDSLASADRHADALRALYGKASRAEAPPPPMPGQLPLQLPAPKTPAATASGSTQEERSEPVAFTDEHLDTLRTKLGLAADADEDAIVAAVTEQADASAGETDEDRDLQVPDGAVLVAASVLDDLKAQAAQGVEARQEQQRQRREQLVAAAVQDGRIRPADRAGWLNDLEKDPERKEATLASLTPGLVPLVPIGRAAENDNDPDPEASALYAQVFGKEG